MSSEPLIIHFTTPCTALWPDGNVDVSSRFNDVLDIRAMKLEVTYLR